MSKFVPAGFVFLSSDVTSPECIERGLFGGKEKYLNRVKGLQKGHTLFSYNYSSKELLGIFIATTDIQQNIVPEAWKGEFPWQVRVERIEEHKPISREDIGKILRFDMMGRPTSRLDQETVDALINVFRAKKRLKTYDDSTRLVAADGHKVRSKPEQEIDNWLFENRIPHAYEYLIPEAKRCDFFIPLPSGKGIYIEYWGKTDTAYELNKARKQKIYAQHGLTLIEIESTESRHIRAVLEKRLRPLLLI